MGHLAYLAIELSTDRKNSPSKASAGLMHVLYQSGTDYTSSISMLRYPISFDMSNYSDTKNVDAARRAKELRGILPTLLFSPSAYGRRQAIEDGTCNTVENIDRKGYCTWSGEFPGLLHLLQH